MSSVKTYRELQLDSKLACTFTQMHFPESREQGLSRYLTNQYVYYPPHR